jgi:hypothetical protein
LVLWAGQDWTYITPIGCEKAFSGKARLEVTEVRRNRPERWHADGLAGHIGKPDTNTLTRASLNHGG